MVRALTMIDQAMAASKLGASRMTTSIHREYPNQYPRQCATNATMEVNLKRQALAPTARACDLLLYNILSNI